MSKRKAENTAKKTVIIRMCKIHRIFTLILPPFLIISILLLEITLSSEFSPGINNLLYIVAVIPLLPLSLYYVTWQIILDANGIHKRLWGINQKFHTWAQIKDVRSTWLISENNYVVSIKFTDGKAIHFRMDCENAEAAKKLILSHRSITEHRGFI